MTKIYIAGPMSGIPKFNYPAFHEVAAYLRSRGYDVVSPAEMDDPTTQAESQKSETGNISEYSSHTWGDLLAKDVKLVSDVVDAVCLLPGWENSRGARLEAYVALTVGKPVSSLLDGVLCRHTPHELMQIITDNTIDQGDTSRYEG